jgi:tRNA dimethylallyltransferase
VHDSPINQTARSSKKAVIVTGATASGKTSLVHSLYEEGDIIVSADSRQIYKKLNIGSAKPTEDELRHYPYRLIDFLEPDKSFSSYSFLQQVDIILHSHTDGNVYIAGGTPFYLSVLEEGLSEEIDVSSKTLQSIKKIYNEYGIEGWQNKLYELDPEYYSVVDLHNPRRLERALQVIIETGETFTVYRKKRISLDCDFLKIVILLDREVLYDRINKRVDEMIVQGLLPEVKQLIDEGYEDSPSMSAIGYRQIVSYFKGEKTLDEAVDSVKQATRKFAKQQLTWFKRYNGALFFHITENVSSMDKRDDWMYAFRCIDLVNADLKELNTKLTEGNVFLHRSKELPEKVLKRLIGCSYEY